VIPRTPVQPRSIEALPKTPTTMSTHNRIECVDEFGITLGRRNGALVVRRPRKASNLAGTCDRQPGLSCSTTSRLADGVKIFGSERP
jgi:hypothetical protein